MKKLGFVGPELVKAFIRGPELAICFLIPMDRQAQFCPRDLRSLSSCYERHLAAGLGTVQVVPG